MIDLEEKYIMVTNAILSKFSHRCQFDVFNFLRGISALSVLIYHTAWLCSQTAPSIKFIPFLFFTPAWVSVWIFFMLSGYLLTKAFLAGRYKIDSFRDIGRFYLSRAMRILPIYYFVLLIDLFFINTKTYLSFDNHLLLKALLLSIPPSGTTAMIGNLWFVCTIVRLYLLLPFFYVVMKKIREKKLRYEKKLFFSFLFILLMVTLYFRLSLLGKKHWVNFIYSKWFFNLDFFCGGGILAFLFSDKDNRFKRVMRPLSLILFFIFFVFESYCMKIHWMLDVGAEDVKVYAPLMTFAITAAILGSFSYAGCNIKKGGKVVAVVGFCGKISMGIYVSHSQTIINLIDRFSNPTDKKIFIFGNEITFSAGTKNFFAILVCSIVFSVIWGCVIHYLLERPLNSLRRANKFVPRS